MSLIGFAVAAVGVLGLLLNPNPGAWPWAFGAVALGVAIVAFDRWLDSKGI